jgi:hypothetical protein
MTQHRIGASLLEFEQSSDDVDLLDWVIQRLSGEFGGRGREPPVRVIEAANAAQLEDWIDVLLSGEIPAALR